MKKNTRLDGIPSNHELASDSDTGGSKLSHCLKPDPISILPVLTLLVAKDGSVISTQQVPTIEFLRFVRRDLMEYDYIEFLFYGHQFICRPKSIKMENVQSINLALWKLQRIVKTRNNYIKNLFWVQNL